jgi:hypothetical protein
MIEGSTKNGLTAKITGGQWVPALTDTSQYRPVH